MENESVEYMLEEIKLLTLRIGTHNIEEHVALANETLQTSCAVEPGSSRLWSWRMPIMKGRL